MFTFWQRIENGQLLRAMFFTTGKCTNIPSVSISLTHTHTDPTKPSAERWEKAVEMHGVNGLPELLMYLYLEICITDISTLYVQNQTQSKFICIYLHYCFIGISP